MRRKVFDDHPGPFFGFTDATFAWFEGLAADNSKAFFDANRATYDREVRGPLAALLHEVAEARGGHVRMFRPHRDVRFTRDKRPIKDEAAGVVGHSGEPFGLYVQVSREGLLCSSGLWHPAPDQLVRLRGAIAAERSGAAVLQALERATAAGLRVEGEALAGMPRGYAKDHPRAGLLRHKELYLSASLEPERSTGREAALALTDRVSAVAEPFVAWLRKHVGPSTEPPGARFGRGR